MKKLLLILLASSMVHLTAYADTSTSVRPDARYGHIFGGLGEAWAPAVYRIGGKNFEAGILRPGLVGAVYIQDISKRFYVAFGGGFYSELNLSHLSPYAGVGADFWKLWLVNFRFEAGMFSNIKNYTAGNLTFGINVGF